MRWLVLGLAGCAGAAAPITTVPIDVDEEAATPPSYDALRARLAKDKLEGLAIVPSKTVMFPTAAAARAASPDKLKPDGTPHAVVIMADEGDVLKVRTWHSQRVRDGFEALTDYDLTLYVKRTALTPVLKRPLQRAYDDGSGYALLVGLPLELATRGIVAAGEDLKRIPLEIAADDVALSIPLKGKDKELDLSDLGEELACDRQSEGEFPNNRYSTRVYEAETYRQEQAEARRARMKKSGHEETEWGYGLGYGGMYGDHATCTLVGDFDEGHEKSRSNIDFNGRHFAEATKFGGDRCRWSIRAYRGPDVNSVVFFEGHPRARLRFATHESALREAGGCGGIGMIGGGSIGMIGGKKRPPKIIIELWLKGKRKVYFPNGMQAGWHVSGATKLEKFERIDGRLCVEHRNVSLPLCFERDDVDEVEREIPR